MRSVAKIAEGLAPSRDMRERRSVLCAVTAAGVTLGQVTRGAQVIKRRALELLDTLLEEQIVTREEVDGRCVYRRVPAFVRASGTGPTASSPSGLRLVSSSPEGALAGTSTEGSSTSGGTAKSSAWRLSFDPRSAS